MAFDIGVDVGGTNIKLGVVDSRGRVLTQRKLLTRSGRGPQQALERIGRAVATLGGRRRIRSLGIGIAGLVDHTEGLVRVPPNLPGWHGTAVKRTLEELTSLPVYCANDANAVTLGEWLYGAGRGCDQLFCVTLGTGVGGGAVVGGRLLLGANHAAGEIGHTVVQGNGPLCRCGGRGCVECYVGAGHVLRRTRRRLRTQMSRLGVHRNQMSFVAGVGAEQPSLLFDMLGGRLDRLTTREIGRAARAGDKLALAVVEEMGYYLGLGLVNVVALLDPERIVVGGGVSGLGQPLLRAVRQTVLGRSQVFSGRELEVVFGRLGETAGIIGASRLKKYVS